MSSTFLSRFLAGHLVRTARAALATLVFGAMLATMAVPSAGAAEPIAQVNPHGTYAKFAFKGASPAFFILQVSATPPAGKYFANPLVTKSSPNNSTYWEPTVEGLSPNTTYYYFASRKVGASVVSETGSFTTLKRQVTVHFWSIHVDDDSDSLGAGELLFNFRVNDGWQLNQVYGEVDVASGSNTYPDRKVVISNAPDWLKMGVQGVDNDCDISEAICGYGVYAFLNKGDGGSTDYADWATANSPLFMLKTGTGESYSAPFSAKTSAYALKFRVSGDFTVSYVK